MSQKKYILTSEAAEQKIARMALEIIEHNAENEVLVLVGMKRNGFLIAEKVQSVLKEYLSYTPQLIQLDFKNGDFLQPQFSQKADLLQNATIILIDDVSNTGVTQFYALQPFYAFQPKSVQTLILVERLHKKFPIKSDYVGLAIATTSEDYIRVEIKDGNVISAFLEN